jgi:hypothetical protein
MCGISAKYKMYLKKTRAKLTFKQHNYADIYRVSQEERLIFWEVIVSVILSKNVCMYVHVS